MGRYELNIDTKKPVGRYGISGFNTQSFLEPQNIGSTQVISDAGPTGIAGFAKGLAQSFFRTGASLGLDLRNSPLAKFLGVSQEKEFIPQPGYQQALLGKEPVKETLKTTQEQISSFGASPRLSMALTPFVAAGSTFLNFSIGGAGEGAVLKTLAKETNPEIIKPILTKIGIGKNVVDSVANLVSKEMTTTGVKKILTNVADESFGNMRNFLHKELEKINFKAIEPPKKVGIDQVAFFEAKQEGEAARDALVKKFTTQKKPTINDFQEAEQLIKIYGGKDLSIPSPIPRVPETNLVDLRGAKTGGQLESLAVPKKPGFAGNINLSKFGLPQQSKDELAKIINENAGFIEQRRGVQSIADTNALSLGIKVPKSLKAGTALNAEELQAFGNSVALTRSQLDESAKLISSGKNTDEDLVKQAYLQAKMGALLSSYAGATAEAGRSLNILKNIREAVGSNDIDLLREATKALGGREKIEEIARRLAAFPPDDVLGKYQFIRSLQKPGASDYLSWYWYSNLLSGPKTHVRNIIGNISNVGFGMLSKPVTAFADYARSAITGTPREVFLGELPHELVGITGGIKSGFKKALYLLQNGYSLDDVSRLDFRPPEVAGGIVTNFIGRSLDAADTFFRSIASQGELYSQAYTATRKSGLRGEAAADFMSEFISNPPVSVMKSVANYGSKSVFREEPGAITSAIVKLKSDFTISLPNGKSIKVFNPMKFVLPFVQTPAKIIKSSLEATPVGLFTGFFKSTAREQSQALGKAAFGTIALVPLAVMASEGKISGSGPKDKELKDLLYRQGWQPNSIRIGDKWYSYSNFQPLALPLSLIANAYESWHYDGENANVGTILAKVGNSVLQNSYLSGVASLQDALADPEHFGQQFASRFLSSLVPLSSAQRQLTQAGDETIRRPTTLTETIQSQTPGFSDEVRPRLDVLGQESQRDTGLPQPAEFLVRLLSPIEIRQIKSSPVEQELVKLQDQVQIGFPSKSFSVNKTKIELSEDEYNKLLKESGSIIKRSLEKAIASNSWGKSGDSAKVSYIKRTIESAREQARKKLIKESTRLRDLIKGGNK